MSLEQDITEIKTLVEAVPVFKPATPAQIAQRPEPELEPHTTREECIVCGQPGIYDHEDDESDRGNMTLCSGGYVHWDCFDKLYGLE